MMRVLPLLLVLAAAPLWANTFVAERPCPLYQSKNKLTNPDAVMTVPGQTYLVTERLDNKAHPQWLRLETHARVSPQRWVQAHCGKLVTETGTETATTADSCHVAGQQDSHILALSWQGAFCEQEGAGKRECAVLAKEPNAPRWLSLTLHGLWPNKASCGADYGFCGAVSHKARGFCDYPSPPLDSHSRSALAKVMPSAEYGSCLERHQWWKHGSCQTLAANDYFLLAARLTDQVNQSRMAQALRHSSGQRQTGMALRQLFMQEFGRGSATRISFRCRRGLLTEIQLSLPAGLQKTAELSQLLTAEAPALRDKCPASFIVDKPG